MKYIFSLVLFYIGDIISKTTMHFGYGMGYSIYQKVMNWSVILDSEQKIWKPVKNRRRKNDNNKRYSKLKIK